jgi:hypothetical protein
MTNMTRRTYKAAFHPIGRLVLCILALLLGAPLAAVADPFPAPTCASVFSGSQRHAIDDACGSEGDGTTDAKRAESRAKNNLCTEGGSNPVTVTFATFKALQKEANDRKDKDIPSGGSSSLPPDRTVLASLVTASNGKKVGEGSFVRLVAFLLDAHHSNVSGGEAVNCKKGGKPNNDIHIALVATKGEDDMCTSLTAEMIPHYRPREWETVAGAKIDRPVRVTGQLFFDASHSPCSGNKRPSPQRASIWEIHPVDAFDVCKSKTLASCPANKESAWIPFDQWMGTEEQEE